MNTSKVKDNNDHIETIEDKIEDSLLEIEWLIREKCHIRNSDSLEAVEKKINDAANRLSANILAQKIQQSFDSPNFQSNAEELINAIPKKLKNQGPRDIKITTSSGEKIEVRTNYYSQSGQKSNRAKKKRKGVYPGLILVGIHDHITPNLGSDISCTSVIVGSLNEARQVLEERGVHLDVKTIITVSKRYAQRAKAAQQREEIVFNETLAGCRVVVSVDGGRIRIREKKRGPKTQKGRNRYSAEWREPKLLTIYLVNDQGKVDRSFAPFIDGTMKGPDAIFGMMKYYLKKLTITKADKILFVADGARWIWNRVEGLMSSLGLSSDQVYQLLDFYHAVEHLGKVANLQKKWKKSVKKHWIKKNRGLLLKGNVNEVIDEIKQLCRGRRCKKVRTERDYFIRNRKRMHYAFISNMHLPIGSGAMESAIRRVINLRLKGASMYWLRETAEAMIMLRSYYKAGRWNMLKSLSFSVQVENVI